MRSIVLPLFSLFLGTALLLTGIGLLGTQVGVEAARAGYSGSLIGLIMAAYFFGYLLGTRWVPRIVQRVGHIRSFAALAALTAAVSVAHALWMHPLWWTLLRALTGIGMVGLYLVVESWLNHESPPAYRGRVFGLYMAITLVSMALGQFLILLGEEQAFVAFGVASILFSLAVLPVAVTRHPQPVVTPSPATELRELWRRVPLPISGALLAGLATGAFWGMGAVFAQRIGFDRVEIASFMAAVILGGALLQRPIGHWSDGTDRRLVLGKVSWLTAAMALTVMLSVQLNGPPWTLWLGAFVFGGLSFTVYPLCVAHLNDQLDAAEVLEATRSVLWVFGAGALLGPLVAGALMQASGPSQLFGFFALVYLPLGLLASRDLRRQAPPPLAEQTHFEPMVRTTPEVLEMHPEIPAPEAELAALLVEDPEDDPGHRPG